MARPASRHPNNARREDIDLPEALEEPLRWQRITCDPGKYTAPHTVRPCNEGTHAGKPSFAPIESALSGTNVDVPGWRRRQPQRLGVISKGDWRFNIIREQSQRKCPRGERGRLRCADTYASWMTCNAGAERLWSQMPSGQDQRACEMRCLRHRRRLPPGPPPPPPGPPPGAPPCPPPGPPPAEPGPR